MSRILLIAALMAMAGCEIRIETGATISPGERVPVRVMCPGGAAFDGWVDSRGRLLDADGQRVGNSKQCAYVETGKPQIKETT